MLSPRFSAESTKAAYQKIIRRLMRCGRDPKTPDFFPYSSEEYEQGISTLLSEIFPFSILKSIRLFSANQPAPADYGYEIDNLFHIREGEKDFIVLVEVKKQSVRVVDGRWLVRYDASEKCAREQVDNHIRTIWEYLEPLSRNTVLRFIAIVVSSDQRTEAQKVAGFRNAEIHLCSVNDLQRLLRQRFEFEGMKPDAGSARAHALRVSQSGFLDMLRLGIPVAELGHPELDSAIRYVDRCRRSLDESLFRLFEPTNGRWAINGSAGMGKSVLLAYTAAVLCSGHELYWFQGEIGAKRANERFESMGFDPNPKKGSIAVMAMSAKQLENIRTWFELFVEKFQRGDADGTIRFRQPEFILCRDKNSLRPAATGRAWSALLVDEAHDLPAFAAREITDLYSKGGLYLSVACDRHQKLRLGGPSARIIDGLDFTHKSVRLKQVYRNPAPIYLASLALMFRWFAPHGPKVLPSAKELKDQFGLRIETLTDDIFEISMTSDAHPANSWCHTVASFPNAEAAYSMLVQEKMAHKDVLWVRFCQEDPDFDYEKLIKAFTYHNCRNHDAEKISNKYIKGQDYPVVVIEGFPRFMDRFEESPGESAQAAEAHAWAFRRELYLCASRATGFLYFICNVEQTAEISRIQNELAELVAATAMPDPATIRRTRTWKFGVLRTPMMRDLEAFADTVTPFDAKAPQSESHRQQFADSSHSKHPSEAPNGSQVATEPRGPDGTPGPSPSVRELFRPTNGTAVHRASGVGRADQSGIEPSKPMPPAPMVPTITLPRVITARKLAALLGEPPLRIILELKPFVGNVSRDQPFAHEHAMAVAANHGYDAVISPAPGGTNSDS